VSPSLIVRSALVAHVVQMARVNVRSWQETYRGLLPDEVLDDPGFLTARERFWTAAMTDERYRENRTADGGSTASRGRLKVASSSLEIRGMSPKAPGCNALQWIGPVSEKSHNEMGGE
jgi:hypothetical protein